MNKSELLQTAKPILFNTEMVRAILDGRKTATRRVLKPNLHEGEYGFCVWHNEVTKTDVVEKYDEDERSFEPTRYIEPRYNIGDILYVRETWGRQIRHGGRFLAYKADDENLMNYDVGKNGSFPTSKVKWKPSIHMPKYAARIFLRVTDVR